MNIQYLHVLFTHESQRRQQNCTYIDQASFHSQSCDKCDLNAVSIYTEYEQNSIIHKISKKSKSNDAMSNSPSICSKIKIVFRFIC